MKRSGILIMLLLGLNAQASASASVRHLVYQFGYNTKVASQGNGTGTTTITIAPAADGGLMVSGQDYWWNTARPRATNTCEVYAGGRVNCSQPPNAISPIQLTLFPLLANHYFAGVSSAGSSHTRTFTVYAAPLPGSSGMASNPNIWNCTFNLEGKGPIPKAAPSVLVTTHGTMNQQGGHYWKLTSKQRIAYDPLAKIPLVVTDVRTHFPQRSVYNNDVVELKLLKDSQ